jgi:hypothetical protein
MLNADELGEKGQSRFRELCAEARLVSNEAGRDRTGWDFIIEFPFIQAIEQGSLDIRPTPLSCHVQVKTILTTTPDISMRLSSAERLAKEVKPTFIYVFRTTDFVHFDESYLIHIWKKSLGVILRRLRLEESRGNCSKINRQEISMSVKRYGTPLDPTGIALRAALEAACGQNLREYTTRKTEQLRSLGYEPTPIKGTLRFRQLRDLDELVEVFLGLRRNVEIEHLQAFEERFGIPLPLHGFASATQTVSIDPYPTDSCSLIVRHAQPAIPCVFHGEIFLPTIPGLSLSS